jgi:hypothetical protein
MLQDENGDGKNYQKPRHHFARLRPKTLLPGSERLATLVDGAWKKDLPTGERLAALFRPFLEYLPGSDLSPKAIRKHVDKQHRFAKVRTGCG